MTSTLVFEGDGRVREYVGGYEDWLRQRAVPASAAPAAKPEPAAQPRREDAAAPKKLSYREQREFEELPARIEALEAEQRQLTAAVQHPQFYTRPADEIRGTLARLEVIAPELTAVYARWDELDARATRSSPAPSSASRSR